MHSETHPIRRGYRPLLRLLRERSWRPDTQTCRALGVELGQAAGRETPYSRSYVLGVVRGNVSPGSRFRQALAKVLDSGSREIATTEIVLVGGPSQPPGIQASGVVRTCIDCGTLYLTQNKARHRCFRCRPYSI